MSNNADKAKLFSNVSEMNEELEQLLDAPKPKKLYTLSQYAMAPPKTLSSPKSVKKFVHERQIPGHPFEYVDPHKRFSPHPS